MIKRSRRQASQDAATIQSTISPTSDPGAVNDADIQNDNVANKV